MKTTKKLIAIILCIATIMSLAVTSSFAFEIGEEMEWTYTQFHEYGYDTPTLNGIYSGELSEEEPANLKSGTKLFFWFEAKEDGCYLFDSCYDDIIILDSPDNEKNSKAMNAEYGFRKADGSGSCVSNLKKGSYLICVDFTVPPTGGETPEDMLWELSVEYLGKVTDITIGDKLDNLILYADLYICEHNLDAYYLDIENIEISFSNGEILTNNDHYDYLALIYYDDELNLNGKTSVSVNILDFEKTFDIVVYDITHFVESIDVPNLDDYTTVNTYYGGYYSYYHLGEFVTEEVTVNFTDKTSKTIYYDHYEEESRKVTLPNGRDYYVYSYVYYDEDIEKYYCKVGIAGHEFISEECEVIELTFNENLSILKSNLKWYADLQTEHIMWCFEFMFNPDAMGFTYYLKELLDLNYIEMMFDEIKLFTDYYFGF